jgi:sugar phosphate isomerase/epimerase
MITRRDFLAGAAMAPAALGQGRKIPVGLEMYSVRDVLMADELRTVRAVAQMGYEVVEFYAPYFNWTEARAREIRKVMDDAGVQCRSTHNNASYLSDANIAKAMDLNRILGATYAIVASAPGVQTLDDWRRFGGDMTRVVEHLKPFGMATGFHNHQTEWRVMEGGKRAMDVLAASTPREFVLQFDVGTCVEAGANPVAWINANPGRIKSVHCKDWGAGTGADRGYRVLFGEGDAPWAKIFAEAEAAGGVEYYLIEQEGSRYGSLETAERCLKTWHAMRG